MASPPEAVPLVTDDEARLHLRIESTGASPPDAVDALVTMLVLSASDVVADYIKHLDHDWDATTAPPLIKAAVLLVLGALYDRPNENPLSPGVTAILARYRDPALA